MLLFQSGMFCAYGIDYILNKQIPQALIFFAFSATGLIAEFAFPPKQKTTGNK